ncbi:hypothetical protein SMICM304S_06952 [Streptomyces microflavus]
MPPGETVIVAMETIHPAASLGVPAQIGIHNGTPAQNAKETSRLAAIPPLKAVPGPEKDGDNEPTSRRFDLGDLTTLPVWSPGNETQEG